MMKEDVEERNEKEDLIPLLKAVVTRDLYAVLRDEENWKLIVLLDFYGPSKVYIELPKNCLDKQKLKEFIDSLKQQ